MRPADLMPRYIARSSLRAVCAVCAVTVSILIAGSALGQSAVHQQIEKAGAEIEAEPEKVHLWLKRGRLYIEDGNWTKAAEDMEQALKIDPQQTSAHFFLAQIELGAGRPKRALKKIDLFLDTLEEKKQGARLRGHMLKGDILGALGRWDDAAATYGAVLESSRRPRPAHFLAHADALSAAQKPAEAIATLEAGLAKLGSVAGLEARVIEMMVEGDDIQGALQRLDRLAASSRNPTQWRVEQGDLYRRIGDTDGAVKAYEQALAALGKLAPGRRGVPAMQALADRAEAGLEAVRPANAEGDD